MRETEAILRSLLLQAYKAKTLAEVQTAIETMCTSDDIDVVKQRLAELEKQIKNKEQ